MISRRAFTLMTLAALISPVEAAEHPSITFMNKMGKDLLHAHRLGTVSAFLRVINHYADVAGISEYSLGDYTVSSSQRGQYLRGVVTFMSRYFAEQSRNFPVAKYEVGEATVDQNKDVLVATKIFMMAGQVYTVNWKLKWVGGQYKVSDAKFLGFSMTYQQRSLFTSFVAKHNGDVGQLIIALNR